LRRSGDRGCIPQGITVMKVARILAGDVPQLKELLLSIASNMNAATAPVVDPRAEALKECVYRMEHGYSDLDSDLRKFIGSLQRRDDGSLFMKFRGRTIEIEPIQASILFGAAVQM